MKISIKVDDERFRKRLQKMPRMVAETMRQSFQQASLLVQNKAKVLAPFKTGNLRRSIHNLVKSDEAQVGSNVIYARIREFRTKRRPDGYLRPALNQNKNKITKIFEKNIKHLLTKR